MDNFHIYASLVNACIAARLHLYVSLFCVLAITFENIGKSLFLADMAYIIICMARFSFKVKVTELKALNFKRSELPSALNAKLHFWTAYTLGFSF